MNPVTENKIPIQNQDKVTTHAAWKKTACKIAAVALALLTVAFLLSAMFLPFTATPCGLLAATAYLLVGSGIISALSLAVFSAYESATENKRNLYKELT